MASFSKFLHDSKDQQVSRWFLVIIRLYAGLVWIQTGWNKAARGSGGLGYKDNMLNFINDRLEGTYGFYRAFLERAVIPNADLFTILVVWGELLAGISLFFGILTRLGAGVGIFLSLNFALLQARAVWLPGLDATLLWVQLVVLLAAAGRSYGVDYFIRKMYPAFPMS